MKNYKGAINLSLTYIAYNDCWSELAGPIGTNIITISMHWQKKNHWNVNAVWLPHHQQIFIETAMIYDFHSTPVTTIHLNVNWIWLPLHTINKYSLKFQFLLFANSAWMFAPFLADLSPRARSGLDIIRHKSFLWPRRGVRLWPKGAEFRGRLWEGGGG